MSASPFPLRPGSVLAIDHGTKRTGFAVTDGLRLTLSPLDPFHGAGDGPELVRHIRRLADERDLAAVLLGLPLNNDGTENPQCQAVRTFGDRLGQALPGVPIVYIDEHLTSKEAEARLVDAGFTGADRKARRDSWSALVMLEEWLANLG
ncbi:MAG: Holliday junction resolvase RuvX [Planctomycetota bacterium]